MKRLFVLLFATVLLVACGSEKETEDINTKEKQEAEEEDEGEELTAHINISDSLIGDSYQVMRIIEKSVEAEEKPEMGTIDDYSTKYIEGHDDLDLTDEEIQLVLATGHLILNIDNYTTIASERKDFENDKEVFYQTIETGEFDFKGID